MNYFTKDYSEMKWLLSYDREPDLPREVSIEFEKVEMVLVDNPIIEKFKDFIYKSFHYFSKENRALRKSEKVINEFQHKTE